MSLRDKQNRFFYGSAVPTSPVRDERMMEKKIAPHLEVPMPKEEQSEKSVEETSVKSVPVERAVRESAEDAPARLPVNEGRASIDRTLSHTAPGEQKTILIIDDDVDTLDMYASVFERSGFNVLEAADGLEGLDKATKARPDIIFTGIIMPRMDGFTMMEALKKNIATAAIPVVINSHLGRREDQQRAEKLSARDFIVRDYTPPKDVVERVSGLLLEGDYIFDFDPNAFDAPKLAKDIGIDSYFQCRGQSKMVLKLRLHDAKNKTFLARFECE